MSTTHVPTHPTTAEAGTEVAAAERNLRTVLRVDAVISAVSGLALAVAPNALDDVLGTSQPGAVRAVGIAFLLYAADIALLSRAGTATLRRFAPAVVVANELYVVATVATIALGWYATAGAVLVAAAGAIVGGLAIAQRRFVRAMGRA